MRRIAFDLDETLGVPLIEGTIVVGWQMRPGCAQLLDRLRPEFELVLWSVSPRRYVDKALLFGLGRWFAESHAWDELPARWKDVRRLRADWLVDESPHHAQARETRASLPVCRSAGVRQPRGRGRSAGVGPVGRGRSRQRGRSWRCTRPRGHVDCLGFKAH